MSFDYELFFGSNSGTVLKTLIEPTNTLLSVLERHGFRGNFFIDYLMFRELEKQSGEKAQSDLKMLKDQICDMVRRGHRIELHLHPHWIDAKYNGDGTWNFDDFTHYSLSSLDEETIIEMFKSGVSYLTSLVKDECPNYKIVAFRAGGWAVQPFNKIKKAFEVSGIKIDSSTSFGMFRKMKDSCFDFRRMPYKALYHFEDDVCIEKANGSFLEIPITSFHRNVILVLVDRICGAFLHLFDKVTDGTHDRKDKSIDNNRNTNFLRKLNKSYRLMFSLSMFSSLTVKWALFSHKKQSVYCYIDHPKDLSRATIMGLKELGNYCESVNYVDFL